MKKGRLDPKALCLAMERAMRTGILLVALTLLFITVPWAGAFELERVDNNPCSASQNLFWRPASATLDTSHLPILTFQPLANQAWQRWNSSVSTFRFHIGGGGTVCNFRDGIVTLSLSDKSCAGAAFGDVLGYTVTNFNIQTGQMIDAAVFFNSKLLSPDAVFLQVAMHELGHVLGLDHSDACGASGAGTLMTSSISFSGPRLDAPQADDIAGVNFIYPCGVGDCNKDGVVSAGDVNTIIDSIFKPDAFRSCPTLGDSHAGAADLIAAVRDAASCV